MRGEVYFVCLILFAGDHRRSLFRWCGAGGFDIVFWGIIM